MLSVMKFQQFNQSNGITIHTIGNRFNFVYLGKVSEINRAIRKGNQGFNRR